MFTINNRRIGPDEPPYIIAELSANHNGSLERAKASIVAAQAAGAHAVKLQTYTADTMTIQSDKPDFIVSGGLWDGYTLYDLYEQAHTPFEWHEALFTLASNIGLTAFSSPFDETAIALLESLDAPAYKIASFELTDLPLIACAARTGKPLLMSTGMASYDEIAEAVETAKMSGCTSVLLFHCISSYPTPIDQANLRQIRQLKETFDVHVGLSDHTLGNIAATTAIAMGACAIEKHFTLDRSEQGPDSSFSIEPDELAQLVIDTGDAWKALGTAGFSRPSAEKNSLVFRRSLYFMNDLAAGQVIRPQDIRRIRPGYGLPPKYHNEIIGQTLCRDVQRGEAVTWDAVQINASHCVQRAS